MASQGVCIFCLVAVPKWLSIKVVPVKRPPAVCERERCHQPSASVIPQRVWFYKAALRGDRSAHLWVSSQAATSRTLCCQPPSVGTIGHCLRATRGKFIIKGRGSAGSCRGW